jgi:hypothetical protein
VKPSDDWNDCPVPYVRPRPVVPDGLRDPGARVREFARMELEQARVQEVRRARR